MPIIGATFYQIDPGTGWRSEDAGPPIGVSVLGVVLTYKGSEQPDYFDVCIHYAGGREDVCARAADFDGADRMAQFVAYMLNIPVGDWGELKQPQ